MQKGSSVETGSNGAARQARDKPEEFFYVCAIDRGARSSGFNRAFRFRFSVLERIVESTKC
jgi:hypothetical protein